MYVAVHIYMGLGYGWVCLTARSKWVWGVGTQLTGIGVRGRVIMESVIFVEKLAKMCQTIILVLVERVSLTGVSE